MDDDDDDAIDFGADHGCSSASDKTEASDPQRDACPNGDDDGDDVVDPLGQDCKGRGGTVESSGAALLLDPSQWRARF